MGRESSSRTKELFINLPSLVLKTRHLGDSAFCNFHRLGVPEQAPGGIPLGSGIVTLSRLFLGQVICDRPEKTNHIVVNINLRYKQ